MLVRRGKGCLSLAGSKNDFAVTKFAPEGGGLHEGQNSIIEGWVWGGWWGMKNDVWVLVVPKMLWPSRNSPCTGVAYMKDEIQEFVPKDLL